LSKYNFPFVFQIETKPLTIKQKLRLEIRKRENIIKHLQSRIKNISKSRGRLKQKFDRELARVRNNLKYKMYCKYSFTISTVKTKNDSPVILCGLNHKPCHFQCGIIYKG